MKKTTIFMGIALLAAACGGGGGRGQIVETVEEGSVSGVTQTIHGPGELLPPITGTNADTTTAFTLNPSAVPAGGATPGTLAGTLPQNVGMPPQAAAAQPVASPPPAQSPTPSAAPSQPVTRQPAPSPQPSTPPARENEPQPPPAREPVPDPQPPVRQEPPPTPPPTDTAPPPAETPPAAQPPAEKPPSAPPPDDPPPPTATDTRGNGDSGADDEDGDEEWPSPPSRRIL